MVVYMGDIGMLVQTPFLLDDILGQTPSSEQSGVVDPLSRKTLFLARPVPSPIPYYTPKSAGTDQTSLCAAGCPNRTMDYTETTSRSETTEDTDICGCRPLKEQTNWSVIILGSPICCGHFIMRV